MHRYHIIDIEMQEPVSVGKHPMVGNQVASCDFIPATTLRGAIASVLAREGKSGRLATLFGAPSLRWSPAWPKAPNPGQELIVPMPFSFFCNKGDAGFEGTWGVVNGLGCEIPSGFGDYRQLALQNGGDVSHLPTVEQLQWVQVPSQWLHIPLDPQKIEDAAASWTGDELTAMHVALLYDRQSAREGALFSRTAVPEKSKFIAYVLDSEGCMQETDQVKEVFLGKRRTAGNGAATLEWKTVDSELPAFATLPRAPSREALVQIMTPAIVDAPQGGFYRGLDGPAWSSILKNIEVSVEKSFSTPTTAHGWSGSWDLPRERTPAVQAGSCYKLLCKEDPGKFHAGLCRIVKEGIGTRVHEGFGWISVDPPWLQKPFFQGRLSAGDPLVLNPKGKAERPSGWPHPTRIATLIDKALKFARAAVQQRIEPGKLKDLQTLAARAPDRDSLAGYVQQMGSRRNPRGWDAIQALTELYVFQDNQEDMKEIRFLLSWVSPFCRKE